MLGMFLGHQLGEAVEVAALGLHLVEKARELGGERRRLARRERTGALRSAPGEHQPRQHQAAAQLRHGGRNVERVAALAFVAEQRQFVGVEIAHRHEPRQQQRAPRARAQERLGERAHGAPRRQQDGHARERQRIVAGARHQTRDQRVEKRQLAAEW